MNKTWLTTAGLLVFTLVGLLSACASPPPSEDTILLEDKDWMLKYYGHTGSLEGVLVGTEITARFNSSEGLVRGSAGCNNYCGKYTTDGNFLEIEELEYTEMACLEPDGVMEQEGKYLGMLLDAERFEVTENELQVITGDDVLIFEQKIGIEKKQPGASIEFSCDSFLETNHISLSYSPEIGPEDTISIILCSNPSTGYSWPENACIDNISVLRQVDHRYVYPEVDAPGASAKEVWTFEGIKKGLSGVTMEYSRPWEGGDKVEWTFNITINVR